MRILIIGTGSIGRRHIASLQALGVEPQFVFLRAGARIDEFSDRLGARVVDAWQDALALKPELAVIATPSTLHLDALQMLLPAGIPCYVEKPVVASFEQLEALTNLLGRSAKLPPTLVGCNLRFLPSLGRLRQLLREGAIGQPVRASFQVGQWLPDWRPPQDYRASYSADSARGGGVVLDLVHELDAARWIFGEFDQVHAIGGHYSRLEIHTEDSAAVLLGRAGGPVVALGLDYVARKPMRRYEIIGEDGTLVWDLPAKSLQLINSQGCQDVVCGPTDFDTAATYRLAMGEMLSAIRDGRPTAQGIQEGLLSAALALQINKQLRSS